MIHTVAPLKLERLFTMNKKYPVLLFLLISCFPLKFLIAYQQLDRQGPKWQFLYAKLMNQAEIDINEKSNLSIVKKLLILSSLGTTLGTFISAYRTFVIWNSGQDYYVPNITSTNIERTKYLGIGALIMLLLSQGVGTLDKHYKIFASHKKIILEIASRLDLYRQKLPQDLIPLFEKILITQENEIDKIVSQIVKETVSKWEQ